MQNATCLLRFSNTEMSSEVTVEVNVEGLAFSHNKNPPTEPKEGCCKGIKVQKLTRATKYLKYFQYISAQK